MLMCVLMAVITVTLMLPVPTLLVASPVPVTRDTLEMGSHVWVSDLSNIQIKVSVLFMADIDECATPGDDNCDTNATCTNTPPGGFTCTCNQGYTGNGTTCEGETPPPPYPPTS